MNCKHIVTNKNNGLLIPILSALLLISLTISSGCSVGSTDSDSNERPVGVGGEEVGDDVSSHLVYRGTKKVRPCPTRIAQGPNGNFYVTDPLSGAVFIYDASLNLTGELKDLDRPLGIAVDAAGNIFVGNNGRDNVEVYANGSLKSTIDAGNIKMPNDMAIDLDGNLYVVDSLSNMVKVYSSSGIWLRNIGAPGSGSGELSFPVAVTISSDRLYVADQGHAMVQVYGLSGNFVTSFGGPVEAFSSEYVGRFAKIQSLAFDAQGRLHTADSYLNIIQVFNADTGESLDAYGTFGKDIGQLNLPLDITITNSGQVLVTNAGNGRVEIINTLQ